MFAEIHDTHSMPSSGTQVQAESVRFWRLPNKQGKGE
jgi:hypothetical protein